jgi:hypothetical protein
MKQEFRMNDEQFAYMAEQMKTARSQRVMYLSGGVPLFDDPQEIANRAWKHLAAEMGFVWDSAGAGSDERSFMAEPTPDTRCDSCEIGPEGHEYDCPEAQV